jgi:uncharacterized protein DUF4058
MDPFLEGHLWPDVHQGLAYLIKTQLVPQAGTKYGVVTSTYTVEDTSAGEDVGIMYPDVEILKKKVPPAGMVSEPAGHYAKLTPSTMTIATVKTVEVRIPVVEIRDRKNNQLITAIEILSPVNKRNPGIKPYRGKRELLHEDGVHLLEIDLLRRGERPFNYPTLPRDAHYFVMLIRAEHYKTEVWGMTVKDPLPVVPVPLKAPDKDIRLDLGKALVRLFGESSYEKLISYGEEPPPPAFNEEEAQWMRQLLKEKKLIA